MSVDVNDADTLKLREQAIDWLIRLRDDTLSDDEIGEFADWLAQDCRHSQAFAYAEDLFDDMVAAVSEEAVASISTLRPRHPQAVAVPLANEADDNSPLRSKKPNKAWSLALLAIAAVWLFAVVLVLPASSHPFDSLLSDYHTATGELFEIQLADGSKILLNTNSAVSVNFDDSKREVILHHGQARFTVATDQQRPFDVKADELNVRALGTVFEVFRANALETSVTVQEHSVQIDLIEDHRQEVPPHKSLSKRLAVGQRLIYRHDGDLSHVEKIELDQVTSWQSRRLVINDRPLGELIEELNRYRVGRVFLSDAQLQNIHVTGVFSLEYPDQILDSICKVLDLKKTQLAGWWVVLHR